MSEISEAEIKSMTREQNYLRGYKDGKSDVLDEIKADIEKLDGAYILRDRVFYAEKDPKHMRLWYIRLKDVIDILEKYKESEDIE